MIQVLVALAPGNTRSFTLCSEETISSGATLLPSPVTSSAGSKGPKGAPQCKVHACSCSKSAWILPYKFRVL